MNISELTKCNTRYNLRYYRLIMAATAIMVAVITGSLITGDSVRNTLINRVKERLGNTETIVFSKNSFFDAGIIQTSVFKGNARAVLLTDGFVSDNGKYIPVMVWGVDDMGIPTGGAKINRELADELSVADTKDLIIRLPATGMVPSGSLFVTDNYTTSVRMENAGIADARDGGNMSFKNEQIIPCNVFVNRTELANTLKINGKINVVLSAAHITHEDIENVWTPSLSGIKVEDNELLSDRVFLQNELVETVMKTNGNVNRLFSYMANSLIHSNDTIPYSFVTAADSYKGQKICNQDVILSDYSASRLNAQAGDSIGMTFFVSGDLKTLHESSVNLRVASIVPIASLQADTTLSAEFPGLSDVEKCTDWDSDLPLDMSRITKEDEDYWASHRATPKAIVSYEAVAAQWSNAYGCATGLRFTQTPDLSQLTPSMTGIQVIHPREAGLTAAKNSIDFTMLFLSLGFFIILAAALLMLVPLSEMIASRRGEMSLLHNIGFDNRLIISMLWKESYIITIIASSIGLAVGILYTLLIITLLNTLWQGAVHTDGFTFHADCKTLLVGIIAGISISLIILRLYIVRAVKKIDKPPTAKRKTHSVTKNFSVNRLIINDLLYNGKRAWLSFATLASGVLIVFAVGLNRPGFTDSAQLQDATGGYMLWCETSIPVYHNLSTAEGRKKLSLNTFPVNVECLQLLRYGADDASCLNLNKVTQPTALGVDMEALRKSGLQINVGTRDFQACDFQSLDFQAKGTDIHAYPVYIDESVLLWGLQMKLGDTLQYAAGNGRSVNMLLAGTLKNSVFQGNILLDKEIFKSIWSEITGSEIVLIKTEPQQAEEVKTLTERALSEYGVRVTPTIERLRQFNSVTDTYLTIFLILGGFGLLIGVAGFVIVVRKDMASRRRQIALMRSIGFGDKRLERILTVENRLIPFAAIITGFVLSLCTVIGGLKGVTVGIWLTVLIFLLLLLAGVLYFIKKEVRRRVES